MIWPIVRYGHPRLRLGSEQSSTFTPELIDLVKDLFETVGKNGGLGLAAPQVGLQYRLAVVDVSTARSSASWLSIDGKDARLRPLVLLNPVLKLSDFVLVADEGCLSVPNVTGPVSRSDAVMVTTDTPHGSFKFLARGLLARVIQHEVDHLNGVLFIDHLPNGSDIIRQLNANVMA